MNGPRSLKELHERSHIHMRCFCHNCKRIKIQKHLPSNTNGALKQFLYIKLTSSFLPPPPPSRIFLLFLAGPQEKRRCMYIYVPSQKCFLGTKMPFCCMFSLPSFVFRIASIPSIKKGTWIWAFYPLDKLERYQNFYYVEENFAVLAIKKYLIRELFKNLQKINLSLALLKSENTIELKCSLERKRGGDLRCKTRIKSE